MIFVQQIRNRIADRIRKFQHPILVRGENCNSRGFRCGASVFRCKAIAIDGRRGQTEDLGWPVEILYGFKDHPDSKTMRYEGQALGLWQESIAKIRKASAALHRDASLERIVHDGQPKISWPKHTDEHLGRLEVENRLELCQRSRAVIQGNIEPVDAEQDVLAGTQGSDLRSPDQSQLKHRRPSVARQRLGTRNRTVHIVRSKTQIKRHRSLLAPRGANGLHGRGECRGQILGYRRERRRYRADENGDKQLRGAEIAEPMVWVVVMEDQSPSDRR